VIYQLDELARPLITLILDTALQLLASDNVNAFGDQFVFQYLVNSNEIEYTMIYLTNCTFNMSFYEIKYAMIVLYTFVVLFYVILMKLCITFLLTNCTLFFCCYIILLFSNEIKYNMIFF